MQWGKRLSPEPLAVERFDGFHVDEEPGLYDLYPQMALVVRCTGGAGPSVNSLQMVPWALRRHRSLGVDKSTHFVVLYHKVETNTGVCHSHSIPGADRQMVSKEAASEGNSAQ